ncbi:DAK2 domain-containing protein, partial [Brevibacterium paucivorans]
ILAVALRGVADELGEAALAEGDLTPDRFASAIELAAYRAQTAIAEPTHGTMLTVLHAMAETARTQADEGAGLVQQITSEDHALRVLRDVEQYGLAKLRTEDLVNGANHGPLRAAAAASTAPLMLRAALTGAIAIRLDRGEQAGSLHDVLSDGTTTVLVADSPEGQAA